MNYCLIYILGVITGSVLFGIVSSRSYEKGFTDGIGYTLDQIDEEDYDETEI